MNGPYSAGPIVKCTNCLDVRRSRDKNSCPEGTKIFSPRSLDDWDTFLMSARPVADPHWIVDVTRPQNGCEGCDETEENAKKFLKAFKTSDGSPWWLDMKDGYGAPRYAGSEGEYMANCYLNLFHHREEGEVMWNDGRCDYHSKSYYCQPKQLSMTPKP